MPVIGYGTKELPAFYTRKSGFGVDYQLDTPEELAAAFRSSLDLGFRSGMLVTNPIPEEYSMDPAVINKAIEDAVAEAKAQGIHGKATTPFLLAKIKELPAAAAWIPTSSWSSTTPAWPPGPPAPSRPELTVLHKNPLAFPPFSGILFGSIVALNTETGISVRRKGQRTWNSKHINKLEKTIAVEEIRVMVSPDWVDRWVELDDEVWTSRLKVSEGFLGKEIWISRDVPGEINVVIYWADYDIWQAHDKSGWCIELDQQMEQRMEGHLLSMEFKFEGKPEIQMLRDVQYRFLILFSIRCVLHKNTPDSVCQRTSPAAGFFWYNKEKGD